jgi:cytochrome c oxidase cbb3-type subunit 4
MDTYSVLRHFADSWGLLALFLFFAGVCLRAVLLPRRVTEDAAAVPFRHDDAPAPAARCDLPLPQTKG